MFTKYSQWNMAVSKVKLPKPKRFRGLGLNRLNNYFSSWYVTKAGHVTCWQKRPLTVHKQNSQQAIANDAQCKKQIVVFTHAFAFAFASKVLSELWPNYAHSCFRITTKLLSHSLITGLTFTKGTKQDLHERKLLTIDDFCKTII